MKVIAAPVALALALIVGGTRALAAQAMTAAPTDSAPAVRWQLLARRVLQREPPSTRVAQQGSVVPHIAPPATTVGITRSIALLSAAQYEASERAATAAGSERVAVAAASALVLTRLQPRDSALLAHALARELAAARRAGEPDSAIRSGAQVGRVAATSLLRWAGDGSTLARWEGTLPSGPGIWRAPPDGEPAEIALLAQRPWSLSAAGQFTPGPPPRFGSAEFIAALDEVRRYAQARTPEHLGIARQWTQRAPAEEWNRIAIDAMARHRVHAGRAAHLLAMVAIASADALIACGDARYRYWLLRPTQADSTIALAEAVTLPLEPSYPSADACIAGAASTVLAQLVPESRDEMERIAHEAAMSGLYAGTHYRFDVETGMALGRTIARWVIGQDTKGELRRGWR